MVEIVMAFFFITEYIIRFYAAPNRKSRPPHMIPRPATQLPRCTAQLQHCTAQLFRCTGITYALSIESVIDLASSIPVIVMYLGDANVSSLFFLRLFRYNYRLFRLLKVAGCTHHSAMH